MTPPGKLVPRVCVQNFHVSFRPKRTTCVCEGQETASAEDAPTSMKAPEKVHTFLLQV